MKLKITSSYWCNQAGKWFSQVTWHSHRHRGRSTYGPCDTRDEVVDAIRRKRQLLHHFEVPLWRRMWNKFVGRHKYVGA